MIRTLIATLALAVTAQYVYAARADELRIDALLARRTLTVTVSGGSPMEGCVVSIVGSSMRGPLAGSLARGDELAQVPSIDGAVSVRIAQLPLARGSRRSKIYLRAVADCAHGVRRTSSVVEIRLPLSNGSPFKSASNWLARVQRLHASRGVKLERAFEPLRFARPVELVPSRHDQSTLFVLEQVGRIVRINRSADPPIKETALDIRNKVQCCGERGLLGMAFHPQFELNRFVYLHYSAAPSGATTISRLQVFESNRLQIDPDSEVVLLTVNQPFSNHNGGRIAFGDDGFLYLGLGDGGSGGDPLQSGQDRKSLLGKILRIDVNTSSDTRPYGIPSSNPFVGNTQGFREEIYAYGLRNPFKFSFDSRTGDLWVGDVGQNTMEEIDIVAVGGNYGWNIMEGILCFPSLQSCTVQDLSLPVHEYGRTYGGSITGGYVYRGSDVSGLYGKYIFGDFVSGRIGALGRHGRGKYRRIDLFETDLSISSFGVDQTNELYVLHYGTGGGEDGSIFRFIQET